MRRDDQAVSTRLQPREIRKRPHLIHTVREIDQKDVPPFDRALDAGKQGEPVIPRVIEEPRVGDLSIVQRESNRVKAELERPLNQGVRVVSNHVTRVFRRVEMKVGFEHRMDVSHRHQKR